MPKQIKRDRLRIGKTKALEVLALCAATLIACTDVPAKDTAPLSMQPIEAQQDNGLQEQQAAACLGQMKQDESKFFEALECLATRAPINWLIAQDLDWFALIDEYEKKPLKPFGGGTALSDQEKHHRLAGILLERLIEAGNQRALDDYIRWVEHSLKGVREGRPLSEGFWFLFDPLIKHSSRPRVNKASAKIFREGGLLDKHFMNVVSSPLIALKPFRKRVQALLDDMRPMDVMKDRMMEWEWKQSAGALDMRVCDRVAIKLAWIKGMPIFDPTLPRQQRDQQIAKIRRHLSKHGSTARFSEKHRKPIIGIDYYSIHPSQGAFKNQHELHDSISMHKKRKSDSPRSRGLKIAGKRFPRLGKPLLIELQFPTSGPKKDWQIPNTLWQPAGPSGPPALANDFLVELTIKAYEKGSSHKPMPYRKDLGRMNVRPLTLSEKNETSVASPHSCQLDLAGIWQIETPGHYRLTILSLPVFGKVKQKTNFEFDLLPALTQ
ncbi:MAG: hypothetical protein JRF33_18085 [Deltaproteobacteria bacterium]|nr:hypothetical protein [Deltaproteobacteria bacterium]